MGYTRRARTQCVARGYASDELGRRVADLLGSDPGLPGSEISRRLGVGRATMAKYLSLFESEGLVRKSLAGGVALWHAGDAAERFSFPEDYFRVQKKYSKALSSLSVSEARSLVSGCAHSGASVSRMVSEVFLPSVLETGALFDQGRIGAAEESMMRTMVSDSIRQLDFPPPPEPGKTAVLMSADSDRLLLDAARAMYGAERWRTCSLGNVATAADVIFDLDLQKLVARVSGGRGTTVVAVFSGSPEPMAFFAEAVKSVKSRHRGRLLSVLCGPDCGVDADLATDDLSAVLQWSETACGAA